MGCVESTGKDARAPVEKVEVNLQAQGGDVHKHYDLGQMMAIGSFGGVLRAEHRHTKRIVSIKVLEAGRMFEDKPQATSPHGTSKAGASPRGDAIPETEVAVIPRKISKESHVSHASLPSRTGSKSSQSSIGSVSKVSSSSTRASNSQRLASPRGGTKEPLARFDQAVHNEISMLGEVGQHEHCLRFYEFFYSVGLCHIAMECWKESLLQLIDHTVMMDVKELQRLMKEMAAGVNHVHKVGVLHRSISAESFVLGGEGNKTVKLTDFGSATKMPADNSTLYNEFGSPAYMSPEMIGDEGYGAGTDIWSLGITYYRVLYGEVPYGATQKAPGKIKAAILFASPEPAYKQAEGKQMPLVKEMPEAAEELVRSCLRTSPDDRPSTGGILRHPFLREVKVQEKAEEKPTVMGMKKTLTAGRLAPPQRPAKSEARPGPRASPTDSNRSGSKVDATSTSGKAGKQN